MVDFNAEDIYLYLPRNLSNDYGYHDMLLAQFWYQDYRDKQWEEAQKMEEQELSDGISRSNGARTKKFFVPTSISTPCSKVPIPNPESPLESPIMANGSSTDLSVYLNDLTLSSQAGATSDNETVFSDDYTAMTDIGEGSDAGRERVSNASSISSDISSTFSDPLGNLATPILSDTEENHESEKSEKKVSPPPEGENGTRPKRRPDIKLLLGQSPPEIEDWRDTPSCSTDNSPESPQLAKAVEPDSNYYEDREFDFLRTEPVKRSTSLKTYKTPPGTPSRKKAVRFADALGLDLESVRHILNMEEPPKVPASAMVDLKVGLDDERKTEGIRYLSLSFAQPGASSTFFQRVQAQKVLLENCVIDNKQCTITGTIRVLNITYHKKVTVRYTVNNWLTHTDNPASYVQNSNDGPTDRFSFSISVPPYFGVGSRLQFCIKYDTGPDEYWDSNYGGNYLVECFKKASPLTDSNAWVSFL